VAEKLPQAPSPSSDSVARPLEFHTRFGSGQPPSHQYTVLTTVREVNITTPPLVEETEAKVVKDSA